VVQPNAPGAPPLSSWSAVDDAKVHAFMLRVIKVFALNPKRVHVTGFSQGGAMTWRFICAHADLLASAAPAAACAVGGLGDACFTASAQPKVELPLLYLHGTKDALAGYACAQTSLDAIAKLWTLGAAQQVAGDGQYQHLRRLSAKGTVVEHLRHDYVAASPILAGHCYPGSSDPGTVPGQLFPFGCVKPNGFVWGEHVMQFFLAHPKP
jgi:poly(3-hydroxybutyrate) depolymerase